MSWWMRSSPMEFSRMTPRAKMIAGLAGMGMGNLGIELRSPGSGALLEMSTIQPVAQTSLAPTVGAQQPTMQQPMTTSEMRAGSTSTSTPLFTPTVGPSSEPTYGRFTPQAPAESAAPTIRNQYAAGSTAPPELLEESRADDGYYDSSYPEAGSAQGASAATSSAQKKPHTLPSGVISLKAEAAAANKLFGFPRWAVIAGGIGLGLIVLYRVTK